MFLRGGKKWKRWRRVRRRKCFIRVYVVIIFVGKSYYHAIDILGSCLT